MLSPTDFTPQERGLIRRIAEPLLWTTEQRLERWWDDPVLFAAEVLGVTLFDYQQDELRQLVTRRRVAVRSPRGAGKTMPAAVATLWFACTRELAGQDWKAPTTAGSWLQLKAFLWPEIHKWARRIRWDVLGLPRWKDGDQLQVQSISLTHGEAFAINSNRPDLLEGAHAAHLLAVVDEGKAVPESSWDAIEGYFSSPGDYYAFALSTPGAPAGRFYAIHSRRPGLEDWHPIWVTVEQALAAGAVAEEWVEQRRRQWGEKSVLYRCHVLGEFAGDESGLIPLSWVEAAIERWRTLETADLPCEVLGVDVADGGNDRTILAVRNGDVLCRFVEPRVVGDGDTQTMGTAEAAVARMGRKGLAIVDGIGIGAGVVGRMRQLVGKDRVISFIASRGSDRRDVTGEVGFNNLRSEAWYSMRELLDPDRGRPIALPDEPMLIGDLTAPGWDERAGGKIAVEGKDEIRKRLGRSTDYGDACVMAFWQPAYARHDWGRAGEDTLRQESGWRI
jgi:hypothetical protein